MVDMLQLMKCDTFKEEYLLDVVIQNLMLRKPNDS